MSRPRNFDLSGTNDPEALAKILEQMVFTSAKDWRRYLYIDRPVRDMIVKALRSSSATDHTSATPAPAAGPNSLHHRILSSRANRKVPITLASTAGT